jgi:ABC-type glycerol-3-phosphate transport system substrate-binding protein
MKKRKHLRAFLAAILCLASIFSFTACKSQAAVTGSTSSTTNPADIKADLKYFEPHYSDASVKKAVDTTIGMFNAKYPNIKITIESVPMADRTTKFVAEQLAGTGCDIVCLGAAADYRAFSAEGDLVDMAQFTNAAYWDKFPSQFLPYITVDKKVYGVPYYSGPYAVTYNIKEYAATGITTMPKTWDEFMADMKKLTKDTNGDGKIDQYGLGLSTQREVAPRLLDMFCWSNGGEIMSTDMKTATINSDSNVQALEYLTSLVKGGLVPPGIGAADPTLEGQQFGSGLVSTRFDGNWGLASVATAYPAMKDNIGVYPIPAPTGKTAQALSIFAVYGISTNSKNPKAAFLFEDFITTPVAQQTYLDLAGYLPVTKEALASNKNNAMYGGFVQSMDNARLLPIWPKDAQVQDIMRLAMQSSYIGTTTAKQALDTAQNSFKSLLQ